MRLPSSYTKEARVLKAFLSGERHTRFSAEKLLHDHCLNSTVSDLQRYYGVVISRKFIRVPGFLGKQTRCCEYWMDDVDIQEFYENEGKAKVIIDQTNEFGRLLQSQSEV